MEIVPSERVVDRRSKTRRYVESEKGRAARKSASVRYENSERGRSFREQRRDREYLETPFIAWDGEGITEDGVHKYVLLANSVGDVLVNREGLSFEEVVEALLSVKERYPKGINIGFGLGYDINMWMKSLDREEAEKVAKRRRPEVRGYRVEWRPGKSFHVKHGDGKTVGVRIEDVLPFFQCSFVKACDSYLGKEWEGRAAVVADKLNRESFQWEDLERVIEYNRLELKNLVALAEELRARLRKVGLTPGRWDGPGAIATKLFQREKVKDAMNQELPEWVMEAARYAYAGGRFEDFLWGRSPKGMLCFEYDINSAYPSAARYVPNLNVGEWRREVRPEGKDLEAKFALYKVEYSGGNARLPGPFFCRHENGTVSYPPNVVGWYWTPEFQAGMKYVEKNGGRIKVLEALIYDYEDVSENYPFAFIGPLFEERRKLKAAGDGAHVGIKLALNSLYGKLAQQVGWMRATMTHEQKIPPYHQLEWAGFITSWCRSRLLEAITDDPECVIAFETDAVFTTKKLDVETGAELGQWEYTEYSWLAYVQSGMHFGYKTNGEKVFKTRGVDRCKCNEDPCVCGALSYEMIEEALKRKRHVERVVPTKLTRFIGLKLALAQGFHRWCTWETMEKKVRLGPSGKREPMEGDGNPSNNWWPSFVPFLGDNTSCAFPVEWINPDPNMQELSELRDAGSDVWAD